jgi:hypothetical protein
MVILEPRLEGVSIKKKRFSIMSHGANKIARLVGNDGERGNKLATRWIQPLVSETCGPKH